MRAAPDRLCVEGNRSACASPVHPPVASRQAAPCYPMLCCATHAASPSPAPTLPAMPCRGASAEKGGARRSSTSGGGSASSSGGGACGRPQPHPVCGEPAGQRHRHDGRHAVPAVHRLQGGAWALLALNLAALDASTALFGQFALTQLPTLCLSRSLTPPLLASSPAGAHGAQPPRHCICGVRRCGSGGRGHAGPAGLQARHRQVRAGGGGMWGGTWGRWERRGVHQARLPAAVVSTLAALLHTHPTLLLTRLLWLPHLCACRPMKITFSR